jgi:hypothetical protein
MNYMIKNYVSAFCVAIFALMVQGCASSRMIAENSNNPQLLVNRHVRAIVKAMLKEDATPEQVASVLRELNDPRVRTIALWTAVVQAHGTNFAIPDIAYARMPSDVLTRRDASMKGDFAKQLLENLAANGTNVVLGTYGVDVEKIEQATQEGQLYDAVTESFVKPGLLP